MTNEILWLAHLCIGKGVASAAHFEKLRGSLPAGAELIDYAQRLIDDGIVENVEGLEKLAEEAMALAQGGPPPEDPFAQKVRASHEEIRQAPGIADFRFESMAAQGNEELAQAFRHLLRAVAKDGASDLHLSAGARPFIRKHRSIQYISTHLLTAEESMRLNTLLLSPAQQRLFREKQDYDYALALDLGNRYRVNLMVHKEGAAGAYRMVPATIPTLEQLGFTDHIATLDKLLSYHNGLILVTGPVGAGKTTTLASMVSRLNAARQDHIITVEDPIEIVQAAKGCNVTQREVGVHTQTFFSALKGALREDPDVIVIGELRDLETIEMAITASETGHLVIGTMHTSDAATTLNRLLDVFPPSQQTQIRASVAESLRGILCQRLLPAEGGGLVLACEILVNNTAIANLIRENKPTGLRNTMETGLRDGMCIMDNAVFALRDKGLISRATAHANIQSRVVRAKLP
jgi:twitching motility protein PilT